MGEREGRAWVTTKDPPDEATARCAVLQPIAHHPPADGAEQHIDDILQEDIPEGKVIGTINLVGSMAYHLASYSYA